MLHVNELRLGRMEPVTWRPVGSQYPWAVDRVRRTMGQVVVKHVYSSSLTEGKLIAVDDEFGVCMVWFENKSRGDSCETDMGEVFDWWSVDTLELVSTKGPCYMS